MWNGLQQSKLQSRSSLFTGSSSRSSNELKIFTARQGLRNTAAVLGGWILNLSLESAILGITLLNQGTCGDLL